MQDMSEKMEVAESVKEPALEDKLVAVMAGHVGRVLARQMSHGQITKLMPDIAQAMLVGAEQYKAWKEKA